MNTYAQETEEERIEREMNTQQGDNFDALWERLKRSVRERREPEAVYTNGGYMAQFGGYINTGDPDKGLNGEPIVSVHADEQFYATKDDLINIAEHCLLRAAQMESK